MSSWGGGQNFKFSGGVGGIKFEFWWGVSSFSGGVGGIKFLVLVRGIGFQLVIESQHLSRLPY